MFRRMTRRWIMCAAATATAGTMMVAPLTNAAADDDIVVLYSAGLEKILVDENDQGLKDALNMICARLMELPAEVDEPHMPAAMITNAIEMLGSEMSLRIGLNPDGPEHMPFYAQLTVHSDDETAGERSAMVRELLEQASNGQVQFANVAGHDGMRSFDADGVPAFVGDARVGGRTAFVAAVGSMSDSAVDLRNIGLPSAIEPVFAFKLETQQLMPLMDMWLQQAPPAQRDMIRTQFEMMGLGGEAPIALQGGVGHTSDRMLGVLRVMNFSSVSMGKNLIVRDPITRDMLSAIPVDATFAEVKRVNFAAIPSMLREMFAQFAEASNGQLPDEDPFLMAKDMTGIDFEKDFFGALGTASVAYTSDTTGGGGFASMVGFVEAKDPEAVAGCVSQLHQMFMPMLDQKARGYVRFINRTVNGVEFSTLTFPGLPIPMELSFAVSENKLWYGMSPQAVLAGMAQARNAGSSILDNEGFMELAGNGMIDSALSCTYMDSSRLTAQGYGLTSALMSGLANAVRSPRNLRRDPGIIMPSFHDLVDGAKDSLTVSMLDGDDLVVVSQGDSSALVGIASTAGLISSSSTAMGVAALGAGLVMPAMSKARMQARQVQTMSSLRQVAMAAHVHAADHADRFPGSLEGLIESGYLTHDATHSSIGPVSDGEGDFWLNTTIERFNAVKYPSRTILAYDRSSYVNSDRVMVAFVDGHVESMDSWAFQQLMDDELHKGVDFNLPSF